MLMFRGLVTKDNIWIRAGPNKCGMLLAAQEIQLIVVQRNRTGSEFTDKCRKERRVTNTTTSTEEGART